MFCVSDAWLANIISCRLVCCPSGANARHGFLFLYELLTGTIKLKVSAGADDAYSMACLLAPLMGDYLHKGLMSSILNTLLRNRHLIAKMPKVRGFLADVRFLMQHECAHTYKFVDQRK
jgi:hypothetical protein